VDPSGIDEAAAELHPRIGRFRSTFGALGFLIPDTLTHSSLDDLAYAEAARSRIDAWGQAIAACLESVSNRPIQADSFGGPMVRLEIAERFAAAQQSFHAHDFDSAAHVLFPRLESVVRQVAIARSIPALQIAYSNLGHVDYLGALLDALEASSDAKEGCWWRYLRLLLVESHGAGLRNTLSHGLRGDLGFQETVSRQEAAALVHAAAFLTTLDSNGRIS
jgi:hypothetical protein